MAEKQGTVRKKKETGERSHRSRVYRSHKRDGSRLFGDAYHAESCPTFQRDRWAPESKKNRESTWIDGRRFFDEIRAIRIVDFHSTVWRRSRDSVLIFGEDQNSRSLPIHIRNDNIRTRRCTRRITLTRALTRVSYALSLLFARRPRNLAIHGKREPAMLAATAVDSRRGRMQGQRGEKKQPTVRGGDKRETTGETAPSLSDFERRRKKDRTR